MTPARKLSPAVLRQRRGIGAKRAALAMQAPHGVGGSAPRQRVTVKASGSRGWYDSPEWRARSKAWLEVNPVCMRCGGQATISDHEPPVRPDDRDGVLRGPIQSMCRRCHFGKSRYEQGEDGRLSRVHKPLIKGADINGLPRDPDHPWRRDRDSPKDESSTGSGAAQEHVTSRAGSWKNGN